MLLRSRKRMGWLLDERGRRTGDLVAPTVLEEILSADAQPQSSKETPIPSASG